MHQGRKARAGAEVESVFRRIQGVEECIRQYYGVTIDDLDVLDIGSGQNLIELHKFSTKNRAIGIDFDVIAQGFDPKAFFNMWRCNGSQRVLKTLLRKCLGIDAAYAAEIRRRLGPRAASDLDIRQMDACELRFPDASFDFVHSYSVFHHLPDPGAGLRQIARVLKPAGVAYLSIHLYTSHSGSLDPRAMSVGKSLFEPWAHLRPLHAEKVRPNAYVNQLRLSEWRRLIEESFPKAMVILNPSDRTRIQQEAEELIAAGELASYSLEELVTHEVVIYWQKS